MNDCSKIQDKDVFVIRDSSKLDAVPIRFFYEMTPKQILIAGSKVKTTEETEIFIDRFVNLNCLSSELHLAVLEYLKT